jgi:hypothetical protein
MAIAAFPDPMAWATVREFDARSPPAKIPSTFVLSPCSGKHHSFLLLNPPGKEGDVNLLTAATTMLSATTKKLELEPAPPSPSGFILFSKLHTKAFKAFHAILFKKTDRVCQKGKLHAFFNSLENLFVKGRHLLP